jgi:hypothetical protein
MSGRCARWFRGRLLISSKHPGDHSMGQLDEAGDVAKYLQGEFLAVSQSGLA